VPNRVALLADQRWLRVLGGTAALLVALACASICVNTARADDLAPPDPSGTPSSSATAPDAETSPAATGAAETDPAVTDGTETTATDPGTDVPAPAPPDTTSSATDATTTTTAPGTAPPATACTPTPSEPTPATGSGAAPQAAGCTPTPAEPAATGTDPTATPDALGTAPEAGGGNGAVDTGATSALPAAPGFSPASAAAASKRPSKRGSSSDAVDGTTDSAPPPSEPAPADTGSNATDNAGTPSGLVDDSSAGLSTATPARPEVVSGLTTADSLLSASFLDAATAASGLGGRTVPISPTTVNGDVRSVIRPQVSRHVVVCGSTFSASVRLTPERILLARLPAHIDTHQAARSGKTGERKDRPNGSRKLSPLVPPAPDNDKPLLPPAPTSSLGSGGSGGMQGKDVHGVVTTRLSLIPPRNGRPVTLVEKQRRALRLFFILERPG